MTKVRLDNVIIIRFVLVFLLVFYHSFAIYGGSWQAIAGYPEIPAYSWLDWLSYASMLEMYVFISGYVLGFQVRTKGYVKLSTKSIVGAKFKRLMIPSIVFSLVYLLMFEDFHQSLLTNIYNIIIGVGHMWFLPMLYLCFICVWFIEKIKIKPKVALVLVLLLSLISINGLPFRISLTMYYLFFFYCGYYIQKNDLSFERFYFGKYLIACSVIFVILFVTLTLVRQNLDYIFADQKILVQIVKFIIGKGCQILYSSVGIVTLMLFAGCCLNNRHRPLPKYVHLVGSLSFGVYLIQQFILQIIYYHTPYPIYWGCFWTPWISFVITLVVSLIISKLMIMNRAGRYLIG